MDVSKMSQGCFKGISRAFQGYFKEVSEESFKEISLCFKVFLWVSQESFENFQVRLMSVLRESFEGISKKMRKFQWCLGVFQGSIYGV